MICMAFGLTAYKRGKPAKSILSQIAFRMRGSPGVVGTDWLGDLHHMLRAGDRFCPAIAATKRGLAAVYGKLGRAEEATAAEYQAEQLARHYRGART